MPIVYRDDAVEVENRIGDIFASSSSERASEIRGLFVEVLDFNPAMGQVSLSPSPSNVDLPATAERVAELDGVHVLYVALDIPDTKRVRKAEAATAARLIADQLGDDLLVVITNTSVSQIHLIYPSFESARPTLRRMVIERDLPRRTAIQQVSNIYWNHQDTGSIRTALGQAFDVEAVTKKFFEEYKRVFDTAMDRIEGFGGSDEEQEDKKLFVQTFFNRLMFIYFLSRKGWLTFGGNNDYLNALLRDYSANPDQSNFYSERLYPLFFFGLNNPQSRDLNFKDKFMESIFGDVPFLNGGLFEQSKLDNRIGVTVPDSVIEPILTDLFDRFNFTVMESTPFDIEVAVDPEMLGKVFEELITGRHDSGSYYTPRPVVSFMCREALKGYLGGCDIGLAKEDIENFVDDRETSGVSLALAPKVAEALEDITVADPACGSGAYLLGMMQELVELRTALFNIGVDARSLYDLKLHIIQRNLYGVDIDEFAVNIAMLRMWLSLVIEYEGDTPEPLPNLDFKVVKGDSLLGPDPGQLNQSRYQIELSDLPRLKAQYMPATADKDELRREIADAEERLRNDLGVAAVSNGVVDWRIEFAEVFANGGFDVVIANPPYVRQENIKPASYKNELLKMFSDGVVARSDLFCYFYVRALQLLTDGGVHVFVCSNSWLDTKYGVSLQEYLLDHAHIIAFYESAVERQFSTAAINTIISLVQKKSGDISHRTRFVSLRDDFERATTDSSLRREIAVATQDLIDARFGAGNWGGRYLRAPDIYRKVIDVASVSSTTLGDYVRGERYLNTGGADGFFVLTDVSRAGNGLMKVTIRSKEGRDWGNPSFLIESQFLRPGFRITDSKHLKIVFPDCHILVIPPEVDTRVYRVSEYLAWGESAGFNRRSVTQNQSPWWRPPLQAKNGASLLWPRTHSETHKCYYNPKKFVSLRFFRLHPIQERHTLPILALLNSTLFAMLKEVHGRRALGHGALETGLVDILPMPFVNLTPDTCNRLSAAVKPLLDRGVGKLSDEVQQLDRRNLDEVVLDTYGLNTVLVYELYESVIELIAMRRSKAKTIG